MREQTANQTRTGHETAEAQGAPAISRRQLLAGTGALGAAALLAGAGRLVGLDGTPLAVPRAAANPKSGANGPLNCRVYTMYANQKLTTTKSGSKAAVTLASAGKRMRVIDSDGDYFKVNAVRPATPAASVQSGFRATGRLRVKSPFPACCSPCALGYAACKHAG